MAKRNFFKHYKKIFVNEFKGYNASKLVGDILSGMTVGAVALPLALAFGAASVTPDKAAIGISAGLITAIVAGIVTGSLGGGSFQISGPTGAMTVVLGAIVAGEYGLSGMFCACLIAGIIMLLAGLFRLGKLIQFIPRPVVTGFTSGIAIVIALGQLGNFFGVGLEGETTIDKTIFFFTDMLGKISLPAVICSVLVVLIMTFYPKKLAKFVPGSLVAIIIVTIVSAVLKMDVATIGEIPKSLINTEHLNIADINLPMISSVFSSAVTIAVLGMIESLLCGTCAANMKKEKFDSNVELIAQGLGNIIIPFFGGVPSTAAIARTSVAINSGGNTRLTSVFQSVFLIACMFVFSGAIAFVPYSALAGVLMVTAWRMNEWKEIKFYFSKKLKSACAMFIITMIATVLLDLTYAVLIGVAVSLILMVNKLSRIELTEKEKDAQTAVIYCTGALFFANGKELYKKIERMDEKYNKYIFDLHGIVYLDVSAVDEIESMTENVRNSGKEVYITGMRKSVELMFERTGFVEKVGTEIFEI